MPHAYTETWSIGEYKCSEGVQFSKGVHFSRDCQRHSEKPIGIIDFARLPCDHSTVRTYTVFVVNMATDADNTSSRNAC